MTFNNCDDPLKGSSLFLSLIPNSSDALDRRLGSSPSQSQNLRHSSVTHKGQSHHATGGKVRDHLSQ